MSGASPEPSATSIRLESIPGGGVTLSVPADEETPTFTVLMSHSAALSLAARTLGLLGYRELRIRDDFTVALAS